MVPQREKDERLLSHACNVYTVTVPAKRENWIHHIQLSGRREMLLWLRGLFCKALGDKISRCKDGSNSD